MSNNTILKALDRLGYEHRMTGRGLRGVASKLLHEMSFPHAHIELQLAHQERNAVGVIQPRIVLARATPDDEGVGRSSGLAMHWDRVQEGENFASDSSP